MKKTLTVGVLIAVALVAVHVVKAHAGINIDTQSAQYQQLLTAQGLLQSGMKARLPLFKKLPLDKKRQWLQRDPLFRKTLKMSLAIADQVEQIREEWADDE